jgi:hypothetical protein
MEKLKALVSGESMSMYFGGYNKKNYGFSVRILSCVCGTFLMIFCGVEGRKIGRLLLFRTSYKNGKLK